MYVYGACLLCNGHCRSMLYGCVRDVMVFHHVYVVCLCFVCILWKFSMLKSG